MEIFIGHEDEPVFAKGRYNDIDGSVTVYEGSRLSPKVTVRTINVATAVSRLREDGELVDGVYVKKDITFNSPTAAANFVTGRSSNGLIEWKDEEGGALKDHLVV